MLNQVIKKGLHSVAKAPTQIPRVNLKNLPYEIGGLEPVISGHLMDYHYGRHHRTYVNNLNGLLEKAGEALNTGKQEEYIKLCNAIKFNGGGHLNHEFFWETLAPIKEGGGALPDKNTDLNKLMEESWGSVADF